MYTVGFALVLWYLTLLIIGPIGQWPEIALIFACLLFVWGIRRALRYRKERQ